MAGMDEWVAFLKARLDEEEPPETCGCLDASHWPPCTPQPAAERKRREIKAVRTIVERYERGAAGDLPEWKAGRELIVAALAILAGVLRDLAAVWSDHPGYPGR
jgi:uncharacterized protein DUF6221